MPSRYLPIDVVEDSDSEGETSGLLIPSGQPARGQVAPRRESEEAPACCSASAAGAAALSILAGCAVAAGISALLDDGAPCETGSSRPGAAPAAPATPRDGLTDLQQQGHEWIGGAAGGADRFNASERWGAHMRQPSGPSARLLLLGLLSGSDRFVSRDLQRRALWAQRPWEYGVAWRFVVGERLPKGDNSRVSLEYESAKYGDVDRVSGASELPPRLASKALAWLVHASASSRRAAAPPRYVALSSDAHLLRLPRLAALLRAHLTKRPRLYGGRLYAGALLRWGAWRGGELVDRGGRLVTTWGCVSATAQAQGGSGGGRSNASLEALSAANGAAWRAAAAGGGWCGSDPSVFPRATAELQLWSLPLLTQLEEPLRAAASSADLDRPAPPRSGGMSRDGAARTAEQEAALLGAAAAAHITDSVRASGADVAYVQLADRLPTFGWSDPPADYGEAMLVREVRDGVAAEAVLRQWRETKPPAAASPLQCSRQHCREWGFPAADGAAECCEVAAPSRRSGKGRRLLSASDRREST